MCKSIGKSLYAYIKKKKNNNIIFARCLTNERLKLFKKINYFLCFLR